MTPDDMIPLSDDSMIMLADLRVGDQFDLYGETLQVIGEHLGEYADYVVCSRTPLLPIENDIYRVLFHASRMIPRSSVRFRESSKP